MEDRLEAEIQIAQSPVPDSEGRDLDVLVDIATEAMTPETHALIQRCMDGTEPLDGPLKYYQQEKINAQMLQMILLRVAGFKQTEIARMLDTDPARVNVCLRHPYSRKIYHAMIPAHATKVIDIRTRMESHASELMDHAFKLALESNDLDDVQKVTFGFLDRAGYAVVNKNVNANINENRNVTASESTMSRIARAMEESNSVDSHIMPNWTPPRPPEDGSASVGTSSQPESVSVTGPISTPDSSHSSGG